MNSKFAQLYSVIAFLKHKMKSFVSYKLCCFTHLHEMTIVHTEVTIIGNTVHVKRSDNLRAACLLQQELEAWFFAVYLPFLFPSDSHSCSFIPVCLELQGTL